MIFLHHPLISAGPAARPPSVPDVVCQLALFLILVGQARILKNNFHNLFQRLNFWFLGLFSAFVLFHLIQL